MSPALEEAKIISLSPFKHFPILLEKNIASISERGLNAALTASRVQRKLRVPGVGSGNNSWGFPPHCSRRFGSRTNPETSSLQDVKSRTW